MITIQKDFEASPNVIDRSRRCYVRRLSSSQYVVTPKRASKSRRLVTFTLRSGRLTATCEDYHSGETCPANYFAVPCYHVLKALLHAERLAKRERKAA